MHHLMSTCSIQKMRKIFDDANKDWVYICVDESLIHWYIQNFMVRLFINDKCMHMSQANITKYWYYIQIPYSWKFWWIWRLASDPSKFSLSSTFSIQFNCIANTGCLRDYPSIFPRSTSEWSRSINIFPRQNFPLYGTDNTCNSCNMGHEWFAWYVCPNPEGCRPEGWGHTYQANHKCLCYK